MNILLVYPHPDKKKHPRFGFSYEMLTIAAVLGTYHHITIRDYSSEIYDAAGLSADIRQGTFDLLILECDTFALKRSQNLIHAREIISLCSGKIPIIAYGNYCYITKKNFDKADRTICSNDINILIDAVNAIATSTKVPQVTEYDSLPYIDRNLLLSMDYYLENRHSTLLQTAKGCENTCVFCQRKGWQGHYVPHSDSYILDELAIIRNQGYRNVWITDENFTFNLVRAKRLLSKMKQNGLTDSMKFFISSWANIDKEFLDLASNCNVRIISFGIESGCQENLDFYKKNIQLIHIPDLIQYANSKGIFSVGNFILGAPMETNDSIERTFALIRECGFDQVNIKTLDYMIGSTLYDSLPDALKTNDHIFASAENGLTSFTVKELIDRRDAFIKDYYKEHRQRLAEKIRRFGPPY